MKDYENMSPASPEIDALVQKTVAGDLSYKFQRLRERLRKAIESGELSGKLPGERALAQKFDCNAKTLGKALTDLAAEGLLERRIGLGTFVKGSASRSESSGDLLVLRGGKDTTWCSNLSSDFTKIHPSVVLHDANSQLRPSMLSGVKAAVCLTSDIDNEMIRDLLVRNVHVVTVGYRPETYSVSSVMTDVHRGVDNMMIDLTRQGHTNIAVLAESLGAQPAESDFWRCVGIKALRLQVKVSLVTFQEIQSAISMGVTAILCGNHAAGHKVREFLLQHGGNVPGQVSVCVVGEWRRGCEEFMDTSSAREPSGISGYYVGAEDMASMAKYLVDRGPGTRPTTLWLVPKWFDHGTTAAVVSHDYLHSRSG